MRRYGLRDDQWDRIKGLLPGREGHVGVTAKDNRLFVEAVLYRYRAGMPWRDLPERFGDPIKIHTRFSRWAKTGAMLKLAAEENRIAKDRYADAKALIDELEKAKGVEGDTVTQELSKLRLAIDSALKANTAVDDTLRRGAAFTASTAGHFPFIRSTTATGA
jgi:transposase